MQEDNRSLGEQLAEVRQKVTFDAEKGRQQPKGEFKPSRTAYEMGTMAGMNRQMRRSVISSKATKKGGVRELAKRIFHENVQALEKAEKKTEEASNG
jgi:hypothetical protein